MDGSSAGEFGGGGGLQALEVIDMVLEILRGKLTMPILFPITMAKVF